MKIITSFCPYLTHNLKFQKNCKKIQKIKKCQYGFIYSQNRLEKAGKKKINIVVLFCSYPMRNRKFQENRKQIQKKLKNTIMAPLQPTIG